MSAAPFDVNLVIDQLQANVPALRQVKGAADYAAIKGLRDFTTPCAYVLLAREKPIVEKGVTSGHQNTPVTFGVVVAVRNYRASERGMQAADDLNAVLGQVRSALLGWIPPVPGGRPTNLTQGDLLDYDQATLLWSDVYQTQHFLQR